jgi:hypothetical protein
MEQSIGEVKAMSNPIMDHQDSVLKRRQSSPQTPEQASTEGPKPNTYEL